MRFVFYTTPFRNIWTTFFPTTRLTEFLTNGQSWTSLDSRDDVYHWYLLLFWSRYPTLPLSLDLDPHSWKWWILLTMRPCRKKVLADSASLLVQVSVTTVLRSQIGLYECKYETNFLIQKATIYLQTTLKVWMMTRRMLKTGSSADDCRMEER